MCINSATRVRLYGARPFLTIGKMSEQKKWKILLLAEQAPVLVSHLLNDYEVVHAEHPYTATSILLTEEIDIMMISFREWNTFFFAAQAEWKKIPMLVILKNHLDKTLPDPAFHCWTEPFRRSALNKILAQGVKGNRVNYQSLLIRVNWRFFWVAYDDIELIQKQPMNRVMVYTRNGEDHLVNTSLVRIKNGLPEDRFERINDALIIPISAKHRIGEKGFAFRDGYIPVTRRFTTFRKRVKEELV